MSLSHTVSMGKGFRKGLAGWFWLRFSLMRLQSDVSQSCNHLRVWPERRSPLLEQRLTQMVDKLVLLLAGGISSAPCRLSWVSSWHDSRLLPDKVSNRPMRKWKFFFIYSYLCHIPLVTLSALIQCDKDIYKAVSIRRQRLLGGHLGA